MPLSRHFKFLCCNWNYLFILFVLEFLCMYVVNRRQTVLSKFDRDNYIRRKLWRGFWNPQSLMFFRVWWRSSASEWLPSSDPKCWLMFDLYSYLLPSLLASLALLISLMHVQTLLNFNIWSCILEHILVYPTVFQYVIIKTLEELYKDNFVPIVHSIPFPQLCPLLVIGFASCLSQRALEASWCPCLLVSLPMGAF
jgi:hypothetical protein